MMSQTIDEFFSGPLSSLDQSSYSPENPWLRKISVLTLIGFHGTWLCPFKTISVSHIRALLSQAGLLKSVIMGKLFRNMPNTSNIAFVGFMRKKLTSITSSCPWHEMSEKLMTDMFLCVISQWFLFFLNLLLWTEI